VMSTFLGNHDVPRTIHYAQDTPLIDDVWQPGREYAWSSQIPGKVAGTNAYERLSVAAAVLMTNRGIPLIYYGDEIGMPGLGDPDNRRFMEWDATGYTAGQVLLLDRMKKLGAIRAAHPALRRGTRTTLYTDDDAWVYKMSDGADTVYVMLNRSDTAKPLAVGSLPFATLTDAMTGETVTGPNVIVPARSARILPAP